MPELPEMTTVTPRFHGGVLHLTLDRPEVRNAMSLAMVREIGAAFAAVASRHDVRAVVLRGAGGVFCAGGDVRDMRTVLQAPEGERRERVHELSLAFGRVIRQVESAPQVVVAVVEGAAMGGGLGLVAVADVALALATAGFALPETTLGLLPAQIAPFVVRRIGLSETRRLALTGARIDGREAHRLGLVHHAEGTIEALEKKLAEVLRAVLGCAPGAVAATKELLLECSGREPAELLERAADGFADALLGPEGQEGTRALVEKRRPSWAR